MSKDCYFHTPAEEFLTMQGPPPPVCIPGILNDAIVQLAIAFFGPSRPMDFLQRMDDVLRWSLFMADCPMHALPAYSEDGDVSPLPGFDLNVALLKSRVAHAGYLRGRKILHRPLHWGDVGGDAFSRERPPCNPAVLDQEYLRRVALPSSDPSPKRAAASALPVRVACMYLAVLPSDQAQAHLQGASFAKHCDWAIFFTSTPRAQEERSTWKLPRRAGAHIVVNLAQSYPDAREDQSRFMKTRLGSTTGKYTKKKLLIGNTIQKSLLATLYVAEHATLLETADLFCWLELDSAFVAENLRAFARAHGVSADDPWFFASLSMGTQGEGSV